MTTHNDQDATLPVNVATVIEKESRDSLINKFDDLETPSGDDFEALIRSGFNQVDDPIQVVKVDGGSELEVSAPLTVTSDIATNEKLKLSAGELSMTHDDMQTLTVNNDGMQVFDNLLTVSKNDQKLQVAGMVQAKTVNAIEQVNTLQLNADALLVKNNNRAILSAELDEHNNPKVTVSGDVYIDQSLNAQALNVTDTIDASHIAASVSSTLASASASTLVVEGETRLNEILKGKNAIFTEHLEARDALGVGINAQSTQAKLHISKTSSDMDALLRVDDRNNDTTPFFINSEGRVAVGTAEPQADFHVIGEAVFGDLSSQNNVQLNNQLGHSEFNGSVAVSSSLAVGKANALAKLDVQGAPSSELLHVKTSADTFIKVSDSPLAGESKVTFYQDTRIKNDLHVENNTTAHDVIVNNNLSTNTATVTADLTAGATTVDALSVNDDAAIAGTTTTKNLWVGAPQTGVTGQDALAGALLNTTLTVKDTAQFKDITASADISTDTALHAQSAHITQGVSIGEHSTVANGKLMIKTSSEDESALLVKDYEDNPLLRVKKQIVQFGSDMAQLPVLVKGKITAPDLDITHQANIQHAHINTQVNIATAHDQQGWDSNAKLAVLSDQSNSTGVEVSHFNGQVVLPIITSKMDKLGLFESNPIKPLHVGAEALFASSVDFASDINVLHNSSEAIFSVSGINVAVGHTDFAAQFDVHGNAHVLGKLQVTVEGRALLNSTDSQLVVTQLSEKAAIEVKNEQQSLATHIGAGQLAINQAPPSTAVNFAVTGQAQVTGQMCIEGEATALEVTGNTVLNNTLNVTGKATVQDGVSISVTNNSADVPRDALYVQGATSLVGTLSVTDMMDVHNGLTVTDGTAHFRNKVIIDGHAFVDSTMNVSGGITARQGILISQPPEGSALHVEGGAQFDDHVDIDGDLSLTTSPAQARVHIQQADKYALYIEKQSGDVSIVVNDGRLGVGVESPDYALDVAEDSQFRKDVTIKGRLEIDESLHVDEYASFRSNINVHGNTELAGEARFGLPFSSVVEDEPAGMPPGIAQVAIDQNHFAKAFAVYHQGEKPVVIQAGRVGIQTESPREALDINGNAVISGDIELSGTLRGSGRLECMDGAKIFGDVELRSDLTVSDDVYLKDTLLVEGRSTFNHQVDVQGATTLNAQVQMNDQLTVENRTYLRDSLLVSKQVTLQGGLNVEGIEPDSQVVFKPATELKNTLLVNGSAKFLDSLQSMGKVFAPMMQVGNEGDGHSVSLNADTNLAPFAVNVAQSVALQVSPSGNVGIGTDNPTVQLDINGDARIRNNLIVEQSLELRNGAIVRGECNVEGGLNAQSVQLGDTHSVDGISNDIELGGEAPSDTVLATQAAVKAYVDTHCWNLAENNKVLLIQSQQEFDEVMNRDLLCNVTILLLPHSSHPQMNRAYKLQQQVRIGSNVSIIGFNERDTRIVKADPDCRFILHGERDALVKGVNMSGFTFDGLLHNGGVHEGNGGAFHLRYVQGATLNCVIENHHVKGNGGAIYGEAEVSAVEANHIKNCSATRHGGGVCGITESTLGITHCQAEYGGAVAYCDDSQVLAQANKALVYGGGAYKCQNLMAQGYWRNNHAQGDIGHHIYSAGCDTNNSDHNHENYWWHALYLGSPVMCNTQPWRNDHF